MSYGQILYIFRSRDLIFNSLLVLGLHRLERIHTQYLKDTASCWIKIFIGTLFIDKMKPEDQEKKTDQALAGTIYHSAIPLAISENACWQEVLITKTIRSFAWFF